MIGPALDVRGGVSAVERVLLQSMPDEVQVAHLPTMVDGAKWRKLQAFARAVISLPRKLRCADVVHIHFASEASSRRKMLLARFAMRSGKPVVMHAHGGYYRRFWEEMSGVERRLTAATLRRASALVVLGEQWREFYASIGVPRSRIIVAPNPVQLPQLPQGRITGAHVRIVYLGLIAPRKGSFDLLKALALLPPDVLARTRLIVAGSGLVDDFNRRAEQLGVDAHIEMHGWVNPAQRDTLLAGADGFVLPSYVEGLPMSLLEAMAWALPVVCTPVGSIPEYVRDDVNGLLVPPGAVEQLAAALRKIVVDAAMRERLGRAARRAVEPLAADAYAQRMCALYRSLHPSANGSG